MEVNVQDITYNIRSYVLWRWGVWNFGNKELKQLLTLSSG